MALHLTWRQEPRETGLAGVVQGERGYDLCYGGEKIGSVRPCYEGFNRRKRGYFWYAHSEKLGVPLHNTSRSPVADIEVAKVECRAYVQRFLPGGTHG